MVTGMAPEKDLGVRVVWRNRLLVFIPVDTIQELLMGLYIATVDRAVIRQKKAASKWCL